MKLIHTSDWHLGARLQAHDRIREQSAFLASLREIIRDERPDALLVAGDIFDTHTPSNAAQQLLMDFIHDVRSDGSRAHIVLTAGNHDSPSVLRAPSRPLGMLGVTVVPEAPADDPAALMVALPSPEAPSLVVGAIPFLSDAVCANAAAGLASGPPRGSVPDTATQPSDADARAERIRFGFRKYVTAVREACERAADGRAPVVLMGHCALTGARKSDADSEHAAHQIGGIDSHPADPFAPAAYVALGHLHLPQSVGGDGHIRYSGSPLAMSFDEALSGIPKSVAVVEFDDAAPGAAPAVRTVSLGTPRELVTVEGSGEEALVRLRALADADSDAFVRVLLNSYSGELSTLWNTIDAIVDGSRLALVYRRLARTADDRDATGSAPATLRHATPLDIARGRLLAENLSGEEFGILSRLVESVIGEVER